MALYPKHIREKKPKQDTLTIVAGEGIEVTTNPAGEVVISSTVESGSDGCCNSQCDIVTDSEGYAVIASDGSLMTTNGCNEVVEEIILPDCVVFDTQGNALTDINGNYIVTDCEVCNTLEAVSDSQGTAITDSLGNAIVTNPLGYVTDINGCIVTDTQGNNISLLNLVTDSNGNTVVNNTGNPVTVN